MASLSTMSSCESLLLSVAETKAGLSAPDTPLLALAVARRLAEASRAALQLSIRAATRLRYGVVGAGFDRVQYLLQDHRAVALDAHVGGKAPHREIALQRIDVDLDPFHLARALGLRHKGHVGIEQQAEIGVLQQGQGIAAGMTWRVLRDVEVDGVELGDADAAGPRQLVESRDGARPDGRDRRRTPPDFRRPSVARRSPRPVPARCRLRGYGRSAPADRRASRPRPILPPASRAAASCRPVPADRCGQRRWRAPAPPSPRRPMAVNIPTSHRAARCSRYRTGPARNAHRCRAIP